MNTLSVVVAVSCLLGGIAIGFFLGGEDSAMTNTEISWKYGDAELVLDLDKDLASDETLLQKIFSEPFSEAGAEQWLKNEQGLFHPGDTDLAAEFAEIDYDAPISRELRDLRNRRVGPWSYRTQQVRIGIPDQAHQPFRGNANVCESGIFRNQRVELFLPDHPERRIVVTGSGRYHCPEGYQFPDIQLNAKDAEKLFGYSLFNKYEEAAAIVVTD